MRTGASTPPARRASELHRYRSASFKCLNVAATILKHNMDNLRRLIVSFRLCSDTSTSLGFAHCPHNHLHKATAASIPAVPVEGVGVIRWDGWEQYAQGSWFHSSRHLPQALLIPEVLTSPPATPRLVPGCPGGSRWEALRCAMDGMERD